MSAAAVRGRWAPEYPALDMISLDESITRDEFIKRLRRVEGWSRVAVIGPYGDGADVLPGAAGINPWLWLRLCASSGIPQDDVWTVLVIDWGHVATTLYLEGCPGAGVIERDP